MKITYPIILTKKLNFIFVYVPVLSISIKAPDIKTAIIKTNKAIKIHLMDIYNKWHTIPEPINISEIRLPKNSIVLLMNINVQA